MTTAIKAREPGTKADVLVYGPPEDYANGVRLFRTDNGIVFLFMVQKLEQLRRAKENAHLAPVGVHRWAASRDGGLSWEVTAHCPTLGKVLDCTSKTGALRDGGVVWLAYPPTGEGYSVIQHSCIGYHGYIQDNPPYTDRFDITDVGPYTTFYGHNVRRTSDGALIATGYSICTPPGQAWRQDTVSFLRSTDEGRSWQYLSHIANDQPFSFSEPDLLEVSPGKLIVLMRVDLPHEAVRAKDLPLGYGHYLYQATSTNLGRTWSEAVQLPLWGHPPNLTPLASGNILLVYGHRREPYSVRAILSRDRGATWDESTLRTLHTFNPGGTDIGYPVATQVADGSIVCAYYGHTTKDLAEKSAHGIFASVFDEAWLTK